MVMLEILRVLAANKKPLQKNVILLFNGAEEAGLLVCAFFLLFIILPASNLCILTVDVGFAWFYHPAPVG